MVFIMVDNINFALWKVVNHSLRYRDDPLNLVGSVAMVCHGI